MILTEISPTDIVFSDKVRESCKQCKNYGFKATCPPNIESIAYFKKLLRSYKRCIIITEKYKVDDPKNWKEIGRKSSLDLQKNLIEYRTKLLREGNHLSIILGGGSCKVCKNCTIPCRHPESAIIPMEATGIDVVKTLKKCGIDINFPVKEEFYRVGAILFDKDKKIVYTSGAFDLLHIGHLNILEQARALGDHLIVGVSTDSLIKKYKGHKPIMSYEERSALIRELRCVDQVVPQKILFDLKQLKELNVDLFVVGDDWKNKNGIEGLDYLKKTSKVVFIPYTKSVSSTKIKNAIIRRKRV